VRAALRGNLSRRGRAEAATLLAECALIAGDRGTAARRYLEVASRYPDLAAAENALFAAARLRAESGKRAGARALFERYIRKYPKGRFAPEVTRRLRALEDE
jgi:TolA-binding protein